MKIAAILVMLGSSCLFAQQAGIDGVVVDQVSGAPLERVHVTLIIPTEQLGPDQIYGAISDKNGHISVVGMTPGRYMVELSRSGYLAAPRSNTRETNSVLIKAGQMIKDFRLEMVPSSMISGRVLDRYGDPVPSAFVQLMPVQPNAGNIGIIGAGSGATDERGEFRVVALPGKFYLQVQATRFEGLPEIQTDGSSEPVYLPTFYPDADTKERASAIEVTAGRDVGGIEIRLAVRASEHRFTVSGVVTKVEGMAFVEVRPVNNEAWEPHPPAMTEQAGKFSITGLLPGDYNLIAYGLGGDETLRGGTRITVRNSDVANVQITLGPPPELTGTVDFGEAQTTKGTISLQSAESGMQFLDFGLPRGGASGTIAADGSFRISEFQLGKFRPVIEPLPENGYVKSVELDGSVAPDGVFELTASSRMPRLKIAVNLDGGNVSGGVVDQAGEPIQSPTTVLLLTKPSMDGGLSIQVKAGKYEFKGVRPGKYRLVVSSFEDLIANTTPQLSEEYVGNAFAGAEEIEVASRARLTKDLHAKQ